MSNDFELESPQVVRRHDGTLTITGNFVRGVTHFGLNTSAATIEVGMVVTIDAVAITGGGTSGFDGNTPEDLQGAAAPFGPRMVPRASVLRVKAGVLGNVMLGIALEDILPGEVGEIGCNGTVCCVQGSPGLGNFVIGSGVAGEASNTGTRVASAGSNIGYYIEENLGPNLDWGVALVSIH